ncbi:MAG: GTPase, partial [Bacteroidota bacterium]
PNSGKSTLFNALLERKRAIVSHIAGTTRDYLEEALHIEGIPVKITDTAGLRNTTDAVEVEGVLMVESVLQRSDLILVINDSSLGWYHSDELTSQLELLYPHAEVALVQNKIDKIDTFYEMAPLTISAKFGEGIKELKRYIYERAMANTSLSMDSLVNRRQANLLLKASEALDGALDAIDAGRENELIALEIRSAISTFGEITGEKWSEEVLNTIFGQFCIGK